MYNSAPKMVRRATSRSLGVPKRQKRVHSYETGQAVHLGSAEMEVVDAVEVHILDVPAEE